MRTVGEAKKLEINQSKFIGKPLKVLLDEIGPQIKTALGDPELISDRTLSHISFYFTDKSEYYSRIKNGEKPTIILVTLKKPDGKKYPPLSPTKSWTSEQKKIYGDMIVMRINVSGVKLKSLVSKFIEGRISNPSLLC